LKGCFKIPLKTFKIVGLVKECIFRAGSGTGSGRRTEKNRISIAAVLEDKMTILGVFGLVLIE
jgi:hypothetical protein